IAIFLMGYLVSRPVTKTTLIVLLAIGGMIAGIGIGFRQDVSIIIPAFLIVVCVFLPGKLTANVPAKIAAVAVCLATFMGSGWLILKELQAGGNSFDVALLGFSSPFDGALGVNTPIYEWAYSY